MAGTETNAVPVAAVQKKKNVGKKRGPYKPRQKPVDSDVDARDRSNIGADPSRGGSRGYDVHFRRRALELAEVVGLDEAALQLGVSVGSMYRWRRRIIPYKMTGGRKKKREGEGEDGTAASSCSGAATTTEDEEDDTGDDGKLPQEGYDEDNAAASAASAAAAAASSSNDTDVLEMQRAVNSVVNSSGQPTEQDDLLLLMGSQRDTSSDCRTHAAAASAAATAAAASGGTSSEEGRASSAGEGRGTGADADAASASSLMVNTNGGSYRQGSAFSYEKKKEVAALYRELLRREGGGEGASPVAVAAATQRVTHRMLAAEAKVSKGYAQKVMEEIREHGDVLRPSVMGRKKTGPGSRAFTHFDQVVLMQLHAENPYRMLQSYKQELFLRTGTHASESVVSRWLQSMFPHETRASAAGHGGGGGGGAAKQPPAPHQDEATLSLMSLSSSSSSASPRKRSATCAASVAPSLLHPAFEALSDETPAGDPPNGGGSSSTAYPATSAQEGSESTATTTTSAQQQLFPGTPLEATANAGGATVAEVPAAAAAAAAAAPRPTRGPKPASKKARAAARPKPAPVPPAGAEQLRTQLEARLLEAAYFVRPLLTAAALASRSPGNECFPKRHVRNAYEYLLQHPDDAHRFVVSFERSGIGQALVQAAAVGGEGSAASTASPYGMLVDLCAAGYVNRIVSCGKQAAIITANAAAEAAPKAKAPCQGGTAAVRATIATSPIANGTTKVAPTTGRQEDPPLRRQPVTLEPQQKANEV